MTDAIIGLALTVITVAGAFFVGNWRGKKAERTDRVERQAKADAKATQRAEEARNEVDRMSDADVDRQLRERARK